MAVGLTPKGPSETVERRWTGPIESPDYAATLVAVGTGVTVDASELQDNDAVLTLSGGAAGVTATVAVTVTTSLGLVLTETLYLPIRAQTVTSGNTARDVCAFALRKVTGIADDPDAAQLTVALEELNDMLAEWRMDGLDIGVPAVLVSADSLTVADEFISAVKSNLAVRLADLFDMPLTPGLATKAERGKMLVANRLITLSPLSFEGPNLPVRPMTGINDL